MISFIVIMKILSICAYLLFAFFVTISVLASNRSKYFLFYDKKYSKSEHFYTYRFFQFLCWSFVLFMIISVLITIEGLITGRYFEHLG